MRIVVFGAGAVGSLFGARLAHAGEAVLLVGREAHVQAIRRDGLRVEGVEALTVRPEASIELPRGTSAELVLVTTKSFDLRTAAQTVASSMRPTPTVLLGNGLGIEEVARRGLADGGWGGPERFVLRVVHTVPAFVPGPGRVRAPGAGEVVVPSEESAGPLASVASTLAAVLGRAGFSVRRSREFEREVWRKVVVNAAINPVTAILGVPNGALRDGEARARAEALLAEAVSVARGSGIDLGVEQARADLARVVEGTAENRSSMLEDVERGRPTEVEAISGELVRRGRSLGLRLPATEAAIAALSRRLRAGRAPAKP